MGKRLALFLLACLALTGCAVPVTQVASGFDIATGVRPPITEDGRVGVLRGTRVDVTNGVTTGSVDFGPQGLTAFNFGKPLQVRDAGDVVLGAWSNPSTCVGQQQGVYRLSLSGAAPAALWETCVSGGSQPTLKPYISMSPNGTLAFSMINNGGGAILRGPVGGPLATLRSGSGEFFNTLDLTANDASQVAMNMEYSDGVAGGLMRGVPVFSMQNQAKTATPFAIEKQSIGALNKVAINAHGTMVVVLPNAVTLSFGAITQTYEAGVYLVSPTLWNTLKDLTLVFAQGPGYCRIGNVDINDAGTIVFEVAFEQYSCGIADTYDAVFSRTAAGVTSAIALRGDPKFGGHQFFDSVRLGEINNAGQVSFLTTYSEPLVDPVKVWRSN